MTNILTYAQIGSAALLIIAILLQQRSQGGLSASIGGSSMEYSTKRGVEKGVFSATVILAIVFIGVSIVRLVLG